MINGIVQILSLLGCAFVFIAALGVLRFPDTYSRIHAATKAGAFGGTLLAIAAGLHFASGDVSVQALLIILFFYLTTPAAGHLLGRTAVLSCLPMYKKRSDQSR